MSVNKYKLINKIIMLYKSKIVNYFHLKFNKIN